MPHRTTPACLLALAACLWAFGAWAQQAGPRTNVTLDGPWQLVGPKAPSAGINDWENPGPGTQTYEIPVLGTPQAALTASGVLPADPYFDTNPSDLTWIEGDPWEYVRTFDAPAEWAGRHVRLVLEGACHRASVTLNDQKVGETVGMFDRGVWGVTPLVRLGEQNRLSIRTEPVSDPTRGVVTHMAYGWDFAPRIPPVGLWKPVRLVVSGPVGVDRPWCRTLSIAADVATVRVGASLTNLTGEPLRATVEGKIAAPDGGEAAAFSRAALLPAGSSREVFADVDVPAPQLWWPNGYGAQPLYGLTVSVLGPDGQPSDSDDARFGIRTLEMLPNDEKRPSDYNWTFAVNGRRIFAQGANWVPVDSLMRLDRWRYERLIRLARDAGMTLLRVWGGGLIETEDFYDLCDANGILVWQEFPLANDDYADLSLAEARENARDAAAQARGHPSLALWGGGNEFYPDGLGAEELVDTLAEVFAQECPGVAFHRASPYRGDDHHWGVWHALRPHTAYLDFTAFRSEAGLQAPPAVESLSRFLPEEDLYPPGYAWTYHKGVTTKMDRYAQELGASQSVKGYVERAQLAQAMADRFNLEICRSRRWQTSGCLLWQFNEPWPAICWSLVDYYGVPKPAYYYLKRSAAPVALAAEYDQYALRPGERLQVRLRLDNTGTQSLGDVRLTARLLSAAGELQRFERTVATRADGVSDSLLVRWDVPPRPDSSALLLLAEALSPGGQVLARSGYEFVVQLTPQFDHIADVLMLSDRKGESEALAQELKRYGVDVDLITPGYDRITLSPSRAADLAAVYDVIWIEEAPEMAKIIGDAQSRVIGDAVSRGVGLIMDGGPGGFGAGGFGGTPIEAALPVEMTSAEYLDQELDRERAQGDHPLLRGLDLQALGSVRGANRLSARPDAKVPMTLADGLPLLVTGTHGRGRCIAYASGLRAGAWNDLYPFAARLIAYAAQVPDECVAQIVGATSVGLDALPPASLSLTPESAEAAVAVGQEARLSVRVANTGQTSAHFVRVRLDGLPEGVTPYFDDNYFILDAGQERNVTVVLDARGAQPGETDLQAVLTAWNLQEPVVAPLRLRVSAP